MKAIEHFIPMMLSITSYNVVLTFELVDEILKCDHSNKSYQAELSNVLFVCLFVCFP